LGEFLFPLGLLSGEKLNPKNLTSVMGFGETTGLSVLLGGPVIKENFRSCNVFF
jgi:hypothetical protein